MANNTLYVASGFLGNARHGGGAGAQINAPAQANTGAGGYGGDNNGRGGISGQQRLHWITDTDVPNSSITITIGAGGAGGVSGGNGGAGGTTSVGALVSASGGSGGLAGSGSNPAGNGFAGGSGYVIILTFA